MKSALFASAEILGQAVPIPAQPLTTLGWTIQALGTGTGLITLLSGVLLFFGACYLVSTAKRPAVLAACLVLLPLPVLISVAGSIWGTVRSLIVIEGTPGLVLTSSEIAGGLAVALLHLLAAMLVSAPAYFVLAWGLLCGTWDSTPRAPLFRPAAPLKTPPSGVEGAPLAAT